MSLTFGTSGAPSQDTINLDALLSTSLFNYNSTLVDQILSTNALYHELKPRMKSKSGGIAVKIPLRYALNQPTTYAGYDEIRILPTDGITQSTWEWRQAANAVTISYEEEFKNENGLTDLLEAKIQQAEDGFMEFFNDKLMQGNLNDNPASTVKTPFTNTDNGSVFLDPVMKLVDYTPSSSTEIGSINQSTSTWWRNKTLTMTATTEKAFLLQMDQMYNNCGKGSGGEPDMIQVDQTTYELWRSAYYTVYRRTADSDNNYPFMNFKFNKARVVWEEKMPDIESAALATTTYGTAIFWNTKFLHMYYIGSRNFVNTPFVRPHNQDAKTSLILWAGTVGLSRRNKHGIVGKIPRTLS
jgi:hypothetical protein